MASRRLFPSVRGGTTRVSVAFTLAIVLLQLGGLHPARGLTTPSIGSRAPCATGSSSCCCLPDPTPPSREHAVLTEADGCGCEVTPSPEPVRDLEALNVPVRPPSELQDPVRERSRVPRVPVDPRGSSGVLDTIWHDPVPVRSEVRQV